MLLKVLETCTKRKQTESSYKLVQLKLDRCRSYYENCSLENLILETPTDLDNPYFGIGEKRKLEFSLELVVCQPHKSE